MQWYVLLVVCSLINWTLETVKWQMLVHAFNPLAFGKAFRSILSGVAISQLLPYKTGEYLGRLLYVKDENKLNAGLLSVVGSFSQLLITVLFGLIGFLIIQPIAYSNYFVVSLILLLAVGLLFYWFLPQTSLKLNNPFIAKLQTALGLTNRPLLLKILGLSMVRYLSFLIPYSLLAWHFDLGLQASVVDCFFAVSCIFFMQTVAPNFIFTDVALRLVIPVIVFSGINSSGTTMDYVPGMMVYIFNVAFPMLTGAFLIMFAKFRQS